MSRRTRWYVLLAMGVLATVVYSRFTRDWNDAAYYGGVAGIVVAGVLVGLPWMEFARDGAFRRRPET
jgi:hypothetical protein